MLLLCIDLSASIKVLLVKLELTDRLLAYANTAQLLLGSGQRDSMLSSLLHALSVFTSRTRGTFSRILRYSDSS